MSQDFYSAVKTRRTVYALSSAASVSDERLEELVQNALKYTPSPFNIQSGRAVLLLGESHSALWDALKDTLRGIVKDPEAFAASEARVEGFKAGHGTVLFFEDQSVVQAVQEQFPLYKDNFPVWSNQSSGMIQYAVWTSLAVEGMGASLQHYSPLIDEWVYGKTGVPRTWKLIAQMPFGVATAPAGDKQFAPLDGRFKTVA